MKVAYEDKKVEATCSADSKLRKAYATAVAGAIKRRIKQLQSAQGVEDLLEGVGKWHPLVARGDDVYSAHLNANYRLIVQFKTRKNIVSAVIKSIEDYH